MNNPDIVERQQSLTETSRSLMAACVDSLRWRKPETKRKNALRLLSFVVPESLETYTVQITVAGPFSETEARETARALGEINHSVYSRSRVDAEGYETDERDWFVERDTDAPTSLIFGYAWTDIQRMQQKG